MLKNFAKPEQLPVDVAVSLRQRILEFGLSNEPKVRMFSWFGTKAGVSGEDVHDAVLAMLAERNTPMANYIASHTPGPSHREHTVLRMLFAYELLRAQGIDVD